MSSRFRTRYVVGGVVAIAAVTAFAQPPFGPHQRTHKVTQSNGVLELIPSTEMPRADAEVSIKIEGEYRVVRANGIPKHDTGRFPNRGNPNRIAPQRHVYRLPAEPKQADNITPLTRQSFGIAVNGVPFDPGAAEFYLGDSRGGWQY
ncbi:MAG: YHYH protein, partial [Aeoliella sp.]